MVYKLKIVKMSKAFVTCTLEPDDVNIFSKSLLIFNVYTIFYWFILCFQWNSRSRRISMVCFKFGTDAAFHVNIPIKALANRSWCFTQQDGQNLSDVEQCWEQVAMAKSPRLSTWCFEGAVASWCNPADSWCHKLSVIRVRAQPR